MDRHQLFTEYLDEFDRPPFAEFRAVARRLVAEAVDRSADLIALTCGSAAGLLVLDMEADGLRHVTFCPDPATLAADVLPVSRLPIVFAAARGAVSERCFTPPPWLSRREAVALAAEFLRRASPAGA